eukprot:6684078-Lingulodinium_polyedra.AAC.1
MDWEDKFAKRITPDRVSCRDDCLRRCPSSITRKMVVALLARGEQPSADDTRRSGVNQLRHLYPYWAGQRGCE